jgi:hypothetical protein
MSRSRLSISTLAESQSRQSRKSWHFLNLLISSRWSVLLDWDLDLLRLIKIFVIVSVFHGFLNFFLDLNQEIVYFYKYLDWDFSSQPYTYVYILFFKIGFKMGKKWGKLKFFSKSLDKNEILIILKNHGFLDLSRWSWLVSTISIKILTKINFDWKILILKILTMKKKKLISNLKAWHFKKVGLDTKDILDLDWSWLSRPLGLSNCWTKYYLNLIHGPNYVWITLCLTESNPVQS